MTPNTDFIADMDDATYRQDEGTKAAVERKLEIIGEAVNQLAQLDSALAQRVSSKRQIIGMRNMLIHGYMAVNNGLVWRTLALISQYSELKRTTCWRSAMDMASKDASKAVSASPSTVQRRWRKGEAW